MKQEQHHPMHKAKHQEDPHSKHYKHLVIMTVLSFICMYMLMYAMVDTFGNVIPNINQFYMAGLMSMPMILIELAVMRSMYMNKKLNAIFMGLSGVLLIAFFLLIRQQTGVADKQFLKSMIPHHAGAILMCNESDLSDPDIKKLCEEIVAGQQKEIDQMKAKLEQLKN